MTKLMISEKQVLSVWSFLFKYMDVVSRKKKLSHQDMIDILIEKEKPIPRKVNFKFVSKESLMSGRHVLVKDKNCQQLVYENLIHCSLDSLLFELQSSSNLEQVKRARREILKEKGLTETVDGVFDQREEEFEITEHMNRQKSFVLRHNRPIRK